jgi:Raf kinase inhibitor-like YbhB/YbcL family protein
MNFARLLLLISAAFLTAAGSHNFSLNNSGESNMNQTFQLTSSAFQQGQPIPTQFSMEANNEVPPLSWSGVPAGTREMVLIADDPDAPKGDPANYPWVHWVVTAIPSTATTIQAALKDGAHQGVNSFGSNGWGGPLPPVDNGKHRYFFHLYALDSSLPLPDGATRDQVMMAMEGHVVGIATLMGTYERTAQSGQAQKSSARRAG